ncbi:hypothetical protein B9Z55_000306 [Caenorhabditis nigoni]|uniref:Uncharacterized protein n=1 Tax=Caenorhabditis nigoni TaxID=1611254 RepID=A0A2G5VNF1_9PELO|nr:hypothetical protein B9Z55_000306 [Caenorhabditis nigoni]
MSTRTAKERSEKLLIPKTKENLTFESVKRKKIWIFIPVLAFPHILVLAYVYQLILSLYFGNWAFFGIITFFLSILLLGIVFDTKATAFCSLIGCGVACVVLLYLSIIMGFGDYSSTRICNRPALNFVTCLFLLLLNSLTIWPLFVMTKVIKPTKNLRGNLGSEYEHKVKVLIGR